MKESSNIIDFDLDFDEEELFAISNMHFEDDDTAEVLVPEELFLDKENSGDGADGDELLLDQIPEVSIQFVNDESADNITVKRAKPMICKHM